MFWMSITHNEIVIVADFSVFVLVLHFLVHLAGGAIVTAKHYTAVFGQMASYFVQFSKFSPHHCDENEVGYGQEQKQNQEH